MIDLIEITKEQALELEDEQILIYNPATERYYIEDAGTRFIARSKHAIPTLVYHRFTNKIKSEEMYFQIQNIINGLEEEEEKGAVAVNIDFIIEILKGIQ